MSKRLRTASPSRNQTAEEDVSPSPLPELSEDVLELIFEGALNESLSYGTLCELSQGSAMMRRLTAARRSEMRAHLGRVAGTFLTTLFAAKTHLIDDTLSQSDTGSECNPTPGRGARARVRAWGLDVGRAAAREPCNRAAERGTRDVVRRATRVGDAKRDDAAVVHHPRPRARTARGAVRAHKPRDPTGA
jgi:hypothetical protein